MHRSVLFAPSRQRSTSGFERALTRNFPIACLGGVGSEVRPSEDFSTIGQEEGQIVEEKAAVVQPFCMPYAGERRPGRICISRKVENAIPGADKEVKLNAFRRRTSEIPRDGFRREPLGRLVLRCGLG